MVSAPAFTSQVEWRNDIALVALSGELDLATAPLLEGCLAPVEADGPVSIMVDLGDLIFIDSTGLGVLLRARGRAETNGRQLLVVGASPAARRLFELTGTQFLIDQQAVGVLHQFARNRPGRGPKHDSDRGPRVRSEDRSSI
jgi:anti-sigma B factor antagonist